MRVLAKRRLALAAICAAVGFFLPGIAKVSMWGRDGYQVTWVAIGLTEIWMAVGLLLPPTRALAAMLGTSFCAVASVYAWIFSAEGGCRCFGDLAEPGPMARIIYLGALGVVCALMASWSRAAAAFSAQGAPG